MVRKSFWLKVVAVCALAPLAFPLVFLSPTLRGMFSLPLSDFLECWPPLIRTLTFTIATTFVIIPLSFIAALLSWFYGARRLNLGTVWLVPLLSGSVVWACLWKLILFRLTWLQMVLESRNPVIFWSFFAAIQVWEFCPTFVFLYWAGLSGTRQEKLSFAEAEGRSLRELVRDVLWPQSRTLTALLTLFYFAQSFQEYVKLEILFRVSEATNTEFITHHLAQYLETYMPANARIAVLDTLSIGIIVGVCGLLFAFTTSFGVRRGIDLSTQLAATGKTRRGRRSSAQEGWAYPKHFYIVVAFAVIAPVFSAITVEWKASLGVIELCSRALVASLLCALTTMCAALISSLGLRLAWPHKFTGDDGSIAFLSAIALCQYFIPALCISLLAFRWLTVIGSSMPGSITTVIVWFMGEFLWAYPLLTIFLVQANTQVRAEEISYLRIVGASPLEVARDSFFKRLRFEYVLLFAFGLCLVFTEGTFNSVTSSWSPWTPSIATELIHLADGRAASFSEMAILCAVALCPIFVTVLLLGVGINKGSGILGSNSNA